MFDKIRAEYLIGKVAVKQNELEGRGFSMKLDVTDNSIKATLTAKADITMQSLEIFASPVIPPFEIELKSICSR